MIILLPIETSAAQVLLRDPPVLLLHGEEGLPETTVRRIILDALDRSSVPSRVWTVESEQPGLIVARHATADARVAYVNINYSGSFIRISYKDSVNLQYKQKFKGGSQFIHSDYHMWVNFLVAKIKYVVAIMDSPQIVAVSDKPREPVKRSEEPVATRPAEPVATHPEEPAVTRAEEPLKRSEKSANEGGTKDKDIPSVAYAISSETYKIAVFPAGGHFGHKKRPNRIADILHASIQTDSALSLSYSYYDELFNDPPIHDPARLWVGSINSKEPNVELVYTMGQERNVDGIVMYAAGRTRSRAVETFGEPIPVNFYMIDVDRRQVYRRKGTHLDVKKMTKEVFADFIRGRSEASQSKSNS